MLPVYRFGGKFSGPSTWQYSRTITAAAVVHALSRRPSVPRWQWINAVGRRDSSAVCDNGSQQLPLRLPYSCDCMTSCMAGCRPTARTDSNIIRTVKWRHSNLWSQYDLYAVRQHGVDSSHYWNRMESVAHRIHHVYDDSIVPGSAPWQS